MADPQAPTEVESTASTNAAGLGSKDCHGNLSNTDFAGSNLDESPFSATDLALEEAPDDAEDGDEEEVSAATLARLEQQAKDMQSRNMQDARKRMEEQQNLKAAAIEQLAKNYALKLDVVKQLEDFEIARREYYDQKRESNAMYWMAFTLIMKRSKSENLRYLDFFSRKLAAEHTYVRCILEMKEESEKLKHGSGSKGSAVEAAFGAARRNVLDDLMSVEVQVAEHVHGFAKILEAEIIPALEGMVTRFNAAMDQILQDGQEFLDDMELAEGNAQQAYNQYREQAELLEKSGVSDADMWIYDMRYRVAVSVLHETWATCSKGLGDLFTVMKQTEMSRRQAVHGATARLHEVQTQVWRKLPELGGSLMTMIATRTTDPATIEKEIGSDIRTGAHRLEQSEEGRRRKSLITANKPARTFSPAPGSESAMPNPPAISPPPAEGASATAALASVSPTPGQPAARNRPAKDFNLSITGPLQSPLTRRVQVLMRKSTNVFKAWKPVVAVLTVDGYIHLFDVPTEERKTITLASTPQEAFDALVPRPDSVNKASGNPISPKTLATAGKEANKKVLAQLSPHFSLNLANCEAHMKPAAAGKEACFEIVEEVSSKGIKKVFAETSQRKVSLRASMKDEMADWCMIIQNAHGASAGPPPIAAK